MKYQILVEVNVHFNLEAASIEQAEEIARDVWSDYMDNAEVNDIIVEKAIR